MKFYNSINFINYKPSEYFKKNILKNWIQLDIIKIVSWFLQNECECRVKTNVSPIIEK